MVVTLVRPRMLTPSPASLSERRPPGHPSLREVQARLHSLPIFCSVFWDSMLQNGLVLDPGLCRKRNMGRGPRPTL